MKRKFSLSSGSRGRKEEEGRRRRKEKRRKEEIERKEEESVVVSQTIGQIQVFFFLILLGWTLTWALSLEWANPHFSFNLV